MCVTKIITRKKDNGMYSSTQTLWINYSFSDSEMWCTTWWYEVIKIKAQVKRKYGWKCHFNTEKVAQFHRKVQVPWKNGENAWIRTKNQRIHFFRYTQISFFVVYHKTKSKQTHATLCLPKKKNHGRTFIIIIN